MTPAHVLLALLLLTAAPVFAQDSSGAPAAANAGEPGGDEAARFEASLHFQTGQVALPGGFATLNLSNSFRFLDANDARRVLVEAWGNPPDEARDVLGMIFPADVGPVDEQGWGVVITYQKDGYVKDSDADGIDYDKLLKEMQEAIADENEERRKRGYPAVSLVGWAERPHYDRATHKLYWARELRFDDGGASTLNYDIRVLGRYGVLSLNAVAGVGQLGTVKSGMREVLSFTEFNQGHRYADFSDSTDKIAAYGVGALIAGGLASKLGLFAKLGVLLLAFKKYIILAVVGGAAMIGKILKGRSNA